MSNRVACLLNRFAHRLDVSECSVVQVRQATEWFGRRTDELVRIHLEHGVGLS